MKRQIMLGLLMIFIALFLVALMVVKLPNVVTKSFPLENPIELPSNSIINFYNLTWHPIQEPRYHMEITLSPYDGPPNYGSFWVDFWVVNETGRGILLSLLSFEELRPYYPDGKGFVHVMSYARGINVTQQTRFELWNLTSDYTYCLVLINFFEDAQNVSVYIQEQYEASPHPFLDFNIINTGIISATFAVGIYTAITGHKQKKRRAKIS